MHATHITFAVGAQFTFPNIDAALAGANQLSSWREIVKVSPIFPSRPILQDVSAWQCPVIVVLRACDDEECSFCQKLLGAYGSVS